MGHTLEVDRERVVHPEVGAGGLLDQGDAREREHEGGAPEPEAGPARGRQRHAGADEHQPGVERCRG